MNTTAIILAGGKSSRMGQDKALMPINGKPLIANITDQIVPISDEIIIGANDINKYDFLGYRVVPDREKDMGPLMGILSALEKSSNDLNFVTACDIPVLDTQFIKEMLQMAEQSGADIVMPVTGRENYEPLFAVYRKSVIKPAKEIITLGKRRIVELFDHVNVEFMKMPENNWYKNINTIDEYNRINNGKKNDYI